MKLSAFGLRIGYFAQQQLGYFIRGDDAPNVPAGEAGLLCLPSRLCWPPFGRGPPPCRRATDGYARPHGCARAGFGTLYVFTSISMRTSTAGDALLALDCSWAGFGFFRVRIQWQSGTSVGGEKRRV